MQLNEPQKKAVFHKEGPMLVLAGPGSGKTRVITERVKELIRSGVKPERILVITFTKAAANEMKERYVSDTIAAGKNPGKVRYGTFHSVFFSILKVHYNYAASNILREEEQYMILKNIILNMDLEEIRDENEFIKDVTAEIGLVKGSMMNIDNYYSMSCPEQNFKKIFNSYNDTLLKRRKIDFDDMLVYTYELLRDRKDIRALWQKQYEYILVDEFQDVNYMQYETTRLLTGKKNNLFVVGDDDQSIYGFRGANPKIMDKFLKDYPKAEKVLLDTNYRSSLKIVGAAGKVIGNNEIRMSKDIRAFNDDILNPVEIREFKDVISQNNGIIDAIHDALKEGLTYKDISVLFRTNVQGRSLVGALTYANIPFIMKDTVPNLYDHWIVQDVLSYIKIALGNNERANYIRIINRPSRYISRSVFTSPYVDINELYEYYEDKHWMVERL
ncbi:MAG: ATP-dependent helicase, partial [Lachnospiraceae bacterium]|nr:ATP-dependent helicase [Lachnospiraceae bacterium]